MKRFIKRLFGRRLIGVYLAVVTTVILGVTFQTQNVLARLNGIGAEIGLVDRFSMTAHDIIFLGGRYIIFVAPAILISILICDLIAKRIKFARPLIYAVGGAAAMLVMLFAMKMRFFDIHLLAGARDIIGISLQMLAGALGAFVFAKINRPETMV